MGNQESRNSGSISRIIHPSECFLFEGLVEDALMPVDIIFIMKISICENYTLSKNEDGNVDPIRFMNYMFVSCDIHRAFECKFIILFAVCAYLCKDDVIAFFIGISDEEQKQKLSILKTELEKFRMDGRLANQTTFLKNAEIVINWIEYGDQYNIKEPCE